MFVKPANLGSSIGISKAGDKEQLISAIEVAIRYDRKIIIEESVEDLIEINCSVVGIDNEFSASVCEQPVSWETFLSFDDKYMRGASSKGMQSTTRKIPAPIPEEKAEEIKMLSKQVFKVLDCAGVSRIDFLMKKETMEVYVNEINTIPGSLAFYLWEPVGINYRELLDKLIQFALSNHEDQNKNIYTFDTELLLKASSGGAKGKKNSN
jgi:D-alanine-D-alanine ligase